MIYKIIPHLPLIHSPSPNTPLINQLQKQLRILKQGHRWHPYRLKDLEDCLEDDTCGGRVTHVCFGYDSAWTVVVVGLAFGVDEFYPALRDGDASVFE